MDAGLFHLAERHDRAFQFAFERAAVERFDDGLHARGRFLPAGNEMPLYLGTASTASGNETPLYNVSTLNGELTKCGALISDSGDSHYPAGLCETMAVDPSVYTVYQLANPIEASKIEEMLRKIKCHWSSLTNKHLIVNHEINKGRIHAHIIL